MLVLVFVKQNDDGGLGASSWRRGVMQGRQTRRTWRCRGKQRPAGEVQGGSVMEEDQRGLEAGLRQLGMVQQVGDGRLRLRDTGSR